jgi:hypothetical protein
MSLPDTLGTLRTSPPRPIVPASIQDVAITLLLATVSIAFVPLLHGLSPLLAIAAVTLISCAIVIAVPAHAPMIAIFVLLFQNLFVSMLSPLITDNAALDFIKGYNFLVCSVMWLATLLLYVMRRRDNTAEINRLMIASTCALAAIVLYFVYGFLQNGVAAAIYLRNIVLPIFLFQLALLTAASFEMRVTPALVAIGVLFLLCGYVELVFRDFWLDITNGYAYWHFDEIKATDSGVWEREMRATGAVLVDLKDRFRFDFLNTPLLEDFGLSRILRVFGPTLSAISYAYGVCFFILFLLSVKRPWLAVAALPLAVFCSVKGALIMILFVAGSWLATRLIGAVPTLVAGLAGLVAYAAFGIHVGLQIGDYHVIGFMGGWNGFLQQPLGRGLGSGGNLSGNFAAIDWSAAQYAGAVDGAAESAVGVLLYQMGIAALVPLWFYGSLAMTAWRLYARSGILTQGLAGFGMFIILTNGLFQEEALFAPPALGLMTCLAGLVIGNAVRRTRDAALKPSPTADVGAPAGKSRW